MHTILLYYQYTLIQNPQDLQQQQLKLCQELGIKGRILISGEGINGTVSGTKEATQAYREATNQYPGLQTMEWKISSGPEDTFPKLSVKLREEIVTLGLKKDDHDVSLNHKAPYIEPQELAQLYQNEEEFYIIDARNEYESRIGQFHRAIAAPIDNFRDFPEWTQEIQHLKDKTVITYCTGGIRCEKASAYLIEQGFQNVRQLHGGIHRYSDETGGEHFDGEMYVFDRRVNIQVNHVNPTVISQCEHCQQPISRYCNCALKSCNRQFICCEACKEKHHGSCSAECKAQILARNTINASESQRIQISA